MTIYLLWKARTFASTIHLHVFTVWPWYLVCVCVGPFWDTPQILKSTDIRVAIKMPLNGKKRTHFFYLCVAKLWGFQVYCTNSTHVPLPGYVEVPGSSQQVPRKHHPKDPSSWVYRTLPLVQRSEGHAPPAVPHRPAAWRFLTDWGWIKRWATPQLLWVAPQRIRQYLGVSAGYSGHCTGNLVSCLLAWDRIEQEVHGGMG